MNYSTSSIDRAHRAHRGLIAHARLFCGQQSSGFLHDDGRMLALANPSLLPETSCTALRTDPSLDAGAFIEQADRCFEGVAAGYSILCRNDEFLDKDIDDAADSIDLPRPVGVLPGFMIDHSVDVGQHEVHSATSPNEIEQWIEIVGSAFGSDYPADALRKDFWPPEKFLSLSGAHFLMAKINGDFVSAAMLYVHSGLGYLSTLGTAFTHRRQGGADAVVRHAVNLTRQCGASQCFLYASHGTEQLYRQIGFEEIYSIHHRVRMFQDARSTTTAIAAK